MRNFLKYILSVSLVIALSSCVVTDDKINEHQEINPQDVYENEKTGDRLYIEKSAKEIKNKKNVDARVALLLPLQGEDAQLGRGMLDSSQLALYELQANHIHLVPIDTSNGVDYIKSRLNVEKPDIILGPIYSSDAEAIYPIAKERNICMITFSNDADFSGKKCVFLMGVMPDESLKRIISYSKKKGLKDVNAVIPSSKYGVIVEDALAKINSQTNNYVKIIGRYSSDNIDNDIKQIASNINSYSKRNTTLLFPDNRESLEVFLSKIRGKKTGKKIKYLGSAFWEDNKLIKIPELTGAWFATLPIESRESFTQRFKENFNYSPSNLASLAYDGVALVSAISKNGLEKEKLNKLELLNPNGFLGVSGVFRFKPDGTNERIMSVYEIRKDGFLEIDAAPKVFPKVMND